MMIRPSRKDSNICFFIRKIADILQNTGKNKEKCFKNPLAFFCDYDYTNGGGAKWSKGV
jgi:hypothetical protein